MSGIRILRLRYATLRMTLFLLLGQLLKRLIQSIVAFDLDVREAIGRPCYASDS